MNQHQPALEVAVVGVGRMGRHHARIYSQIPRAKLVAVVDADADRAGTVADDFNCEALSSTDELLARFPNLAAATIAVPTQYHVEAAWPLLQRGIACLIEKPLAPSAADADQLVQLAARDSAVLQVGHTERFNPAVRAVAAMNIEPRFIEVDRVSPMTFRSLDVGVVMDMMIHDLDIVLMLTGSPIADVQAAGIAVLGKGEDVANARLTFVSGAVANITASRLALKTERKLRLFSESAYVSLDYHKRTGLVIQLADNAAALDTVRKQIEDGADLSDLDYADLVNVSELTMDLPEGENDPLTAELLSFLDAAASRTPPQVDARAGSAAVDAAERVVAAIQAQAFGPTLKR